MHRRDYPLLITAFWVALLPAVTAAGEPEVLAVNAQRAGDRTYTFRVQLRHDDEGWQHYADRWEVLTPSGEVVATRVLLHPHVDEQPFTRSLGDVRVPPESGQLVIRAHDSIHGYGRKTMTIDLPR